MLTKEKLEKKMFIKDFRGMLEILLWINQKSKKKSMIKRLKTRKEALKT